MDQVRAITEIQAENFLSLKKFSIELDSLTVLVGPNGGGKSNLLSLFRFLGEVARTDLAPAVDSVYGGFKNMFFRGDTPGRNVKIHIKAQVTEHSSAAAPDEYTLSIRSANLKDSAVLIRTETVVLKRYRGRGRRITLMGRKVEFANEQDSFAKSKNSLNIQSNSSALSVLRRIGERTDTKQISQLAEIFEDMRLFEPDVNMARQDSEFARQDSLESNAENLVSVIYRMRSETPDIFEALQNDVRHILPGFKQFSFHHTAGARDTVKIHIHERGLRDSTPITRASFGTIRAIALFTMLREPNPPRLTCIEEVDHGLHPYALDVLIERLREASSRTQIVIATHSPALVNRLKPSELRILERDWARGETRLVDLSPAKLESIRKKSGYELGELWFSGSLGGIP